MKEKFLIFKDTTSGEIWEHSVKDWILTFCDFKTPIHPTLMKAGSSQNGKDVKGHTVVITAVLRESDKES